MRRVLLGLVVLALAGCQPDTASEVEIALVPWAGEQSLSGLRAVLDEGPPPVLDAAPPVTYQSDTAIPSQADSAPTMDPHAAPPAMDPHAAPPIEKTGESEGSIEAIEKADTPPDEAPVSDRPARRRPAEAPEVTRDSRSGAVRSIDPPVSSGLHRPAPRDAAPNASRDNAERTERANRRRNAEATDAPRNREHPAPSGETKIVVKVEVLGGSTVPEPGSVPYDDCLTTLKVRVEEVVEGRFRGGTMYVLAPGMEHGRVNRMVANPTRGAKVVLTVRPLSEMPDKQRMMTADDYTSDSAPRFVITDFRLGW